MTDDRENQDTLPMTPWSGAAGVVATAERSARAVVAGRYEILGLLGAGGMGAVYRALDRELDETVALKMLRDSEQVSERALERFRREVKLARRVTHPNVARTFDIGDHGREKFLTMEYVDGEPLSALIAREGALAPPRAANILSSVCAGLAAAHDAGVVHRDLKPENVLLERGGRVVITDFGIACAREGSGHVARTLEGVVGTPAYMAPEQVEAAPDVDRRADIYALGVMLFELLTGRLPWQGDSAYTVAGARLTQPPPNPRAFMPELSDALAALVLRCMARDREQRFSSASEVASLLSAETPTLDIGPASSRRAAPARMPVEPDAATGRGDKTLAVLPFRNAGPAEDEYVAAGLTEDLTDTLCMTAGLKVRPRASADAVGKPGMDPREAGRALGVQVVVDGSVRNLGDSVRIAARVIGVADGFQLWAKRFDRPRADLLVVSDEVAHAIAEALTLDASAPLRVAPTDATAIDLYLRGRAELRRIWREPMRRAVELFEQAHALAPNDPTLLAATARARARLWYYEGGVQQGQRARELAEQALANAPERGESWLALASVRLVEQDLESTARLLEQALRRAPQLAEAHELLGEVLLEVADLDHALARFRTALALEPALRCRFPMIRAHALLGRWHEVDALLDVPAEDEQSQSHELASRARLALWEPGRRPAALQIRTPPNAEDTLPLRYVEACLDALRHGTAGPGVREFIDGQFVQERQAPRFVTFKHQLAAEILASVGAHDEALRHVALAVDAGSADRNWIERAPPLAALAGRHELAGLRDQVASRADRVAAALGPLGARSAPVASA